MGIEGKQDTLLSVELRSPSGHVPFIPAYKRRLLFVTVAWMYRMLILHVVQSLLGRVSMVKRARILLSRGKAGSNDADLRTKSRYIQL